MHPRAAVLLLLCVVAPAADVRLRAQTPGVGSGEGFDVAPVELDGAVLFRVRGTSSLPADVRARGIHERIVAMARDGTPVESLRIVERDGILQIQSSDRLIFGVAEADAAVEGVPRAELAQVELMRLRDAITGYRAARSPGALRRSAIDTLVATVLLAGAVALLAWLWRGLERRISARLRARIQTVGIQSFEVVRADRIRSALRSLIYAMRTLVMLALGLVYVGYVLNRWPSTRGLSSDLAAFALGPLAVIGAGVVASIPSLVFLAVLFVILRFLVKLLRLFFEAVERGTVTLANFDPEWAQPTYKIVRLALAAFGLIIAYPYIPGSQSDAFKGVSVFLGIVFSLGSSSAISNVIAGYTMTYRRAFKVGDRVKIGGSIGDVVETRLQVTHLRSFKNEEIVIPNSQILSGEVLNYTSLARVHGLIFHTEVGIGYETPWRQVEAMLLESARRTPEVATSPGPFVLMKSLGDFAVVYEINVYCSDPRAWGRVYTALHQNILDVFNEYNVQIMTPAYENDTAEPKVVPPKDWYLAPAARRVEHS